MTQRNDDSKRAEIPAINETSNSRAELSAVREAVIPTEEDDRDAAIISAMIGAARDWH